MFVGALFSYQRLGGIFMATHLFTHKGPSIAQAKKTKMLTLLLCESRPLCWSSGVTASCFTYLEFCAQHVVLYAYIVYGRKQINRIKLNWDLKSLKICQCFQLCNTIECDVMSISTDDDKVSNKNKICYVTNNDHKHGI